MSTYVELIEYARQDGPGQWYREFIYELGQENQGLLAAIQYLAGVYRDCPDRVDDDHDEWCRLCAAWLWLTTDGEQRGTPDDGAPVVPEVDSP